MHREHWYFSCICQFNIFINLDLLRFCQFSISIFIKKYISICAACDRFLVINNNAEGANADAKQTLGVLDLFDTDKADRPEPRPTLEQPLQLKTNLTKSSFGKFYILLCRIQFALVFKTYVHFLHTFCVGYSSHPTPHLIMCS